MSDKENNKYDSYAPTVLVSIVVTGLIMLALINKSPHENHPIDLVGVTILFDDGKTYSEPKNMRYKSMYEYQKKPEYGWKPFVQRGKVSESSIYVFCMDDDEGKTYTSEIDTGRKDVFLVPKSCPTDGACTLDKDCRTKENK